MTQRNSATVAKKLTARLLTKVGIAIRELQRQGIARERISYRDAGTNVDILVDGVKRKTIFFKVKDQYAWMRQRP